MDGARATAAGSEGADRTARGRDFVVFFEEKEGTTAIVRMLNGFPQVDVLRARGEWEPFDRHACGDMGPEAMRQCMDLVFARAPLERINDLYRKTAGRPLSPFRREASVGFKTRWHALPDPEAVVDVIRSHDVLVFIAVRQNVLRWALSKYHGDGSGRPGHLQFQLASGALEREQIPRIEVDPDALERVIESCEELHAEKRRLAAGLRERGIDVAPLRYEEFVADGRRFFERLLDMLGRRATDDEMEAALTRDIRLKRVHGDDLSEFFLNAQELEARFGDRFEAW